MECSQPFRVIKERDEVYDNYLKQVLILFK